jgi:hypothetical protein
MSREIPLKLMKFSSLSLQELCDLIGEALNAADNPQSAEAKRIKVKHEELGVDELLGQALGEWMDFYDSYQLIKMTEMHMFYEANKEKLDKEVGERQREMLGMKILDNWNDESKALAAMHVSQVAVGHSQGLFTDEQLHVYLHQCILRLRANEGGLGFGDD